jgi:hypothetical protein
LASCDKRPSCESVEATATSLALETGALEPQKAEEVEEGWERGVHSQTYISGDSVGGNSSCARCHAPMNWQPLTSERPQAWVVHNVAGISAPIEISEQVWDHVSCEVCHAQPSSEIDGEISWLEIPTLGIYESITSTDQLCSKCHIPEVDSEHPPFIFEGVHVDLSCIDCHDAHDGSATCGTSACHQTFAQECIEIETHDKPHSGVTCGGCHDGMDLAIGWNEELGKWDTYFGGDPRLEQDARPINSHYIVLEVDCDRCHAPGDHPWDPK